VLKRRSSISFRWQWRIQDLKTRVPKSRAEGERIEARAEWPSAAGASIEAPRGWGLGRAYPHPNFGGVCGGAMPSPGNFSILSLKMATFRAFWTLAHVARGPWPTPPPRIQCPLKSCSDRPLCSRWHFELNHLMSVLDSDFWFYAFNDQWTATALGTPLTIHVVYVNMTCSVDLMFSLAVVARLSCIYFIVFGWSHLTTYAPATQCVIALRHVTWLSRCLDQRKFRPAAESRAEPRYRQGGRSRQNWSVFTKTLLGNLQSMMKNCPVIFAYCMRRSAVSDSEIMVGSHQNLKGSRDLATPLWGMICCRHCETRSLKDVINFMWESGMMYSVVIRYFYLITMIYWYLWNLTYGLSTNGFSRDLERPSWLLLLL